MAEEPAEEEAAAEAEPEATDLGANDMPAEVAPVQ